MHPACWEFKCPTCGARVGERCKTASGGKVYEAHGRRLQKWKQAHPVRPKGKKRAQSVRAVSGGAFEQNRRRH